MKNIVPVCGHLLVEYLTGDVREYMLKKANIDAENSSLVLPDEFMTKHATPIGRGKVIRLANDAFGEVFKLRFGSDVEKPSVGDTVIFPKYSGISIDPEGKYQLIADKDLMAIERG